MRTFSCFITEGGCGTPTLSLILASDEHRARELAQRELLDAREPQAVEICEGARLLWSQRIEPKARAARRPKAA